MRTNLRSPLNFVEYFLYICSWTIRQNLTTRCPSYQNPTVLHNIHVHNLSGIATNVVIYSVVHIQSAQSWRDQERSVDTSELAIIRPLLPVLGCPWPLQNPNDVHKRQTLTPLVGWDLKTNTTASIYTLPPLETRLAVARLQTRRTVTSLLTWQDLARQVGKDGSPDPGNSALHCIDVDWHWVRSLNEIAGPHDMGSVLR